MKRSTARSMHAATNMAYWIENPDWFTGNSVVDGGLRAFRKSPIRCHELLKRAFYDTEKLIAVNGESVVVDRGETVDKFMFRHPGSMALKAFEGHVIGEVGSVVHRLPTIALPTTVAIKSADIFRKSSTRLDAVTQSQTKLDLRTHIALDLADVAKGASSTQLDQTAKDLEVLLAGTAKLIAEDGYYPDIAKSSGNLRRSAEDGAITLIDVMPFYENGSRLIGGNPPMVIEHIQANIQEYESFVGQFGG